jgi:hypothetical protein
VSFPPGWQTAAIDEVDTMLCRLDVDAQQHSCAMKLDVQGLSGSCSWVRGTCFRGFGCARSRCRSSSSTKAKSS